MEFASGNGEKMPRNIRFAYNSLYGSTSDVKLFRPEETAEGFNFVDNQYTFSDGSEIKMNGFMQASPACDYASMERQRVEKAIAGVGPEWYASNRNDLAYIKSTYSRLISQK